MPLKNNKIMAGILYKPKQSCTRTLARTRTCKCSLKWFMLLNILSSLLLMTISYHQVSSFPTTTRCITKKTYTISANTHYVHNIHYENTNNVRAKGLVRNKFNEHNNGFFRLYSSAVSSSSGDGKDIKVALNQNTNNIHDNCDTIAIGKRARFLSSLPSIVCNKTKKLSLDEMDQNIIKTAVPSMLNMAVVPIVNSVDTFWVGRLGIALALAGQAAANQAFFTLFFLVSFLPTITAPLVATAVGSGDEEEAQNRVCEALFLSNMLGLIGTIMLVGFPQTSLGLVLSKDAAAMEYAIPYLRFRALSMIPALISATGFSAYRGLLNTVTPLKVSLTTNLVNLIADPLLIKGFGVAGAAIATAGAEGLSGLIYLRLLIRRKLVELSRMFKVPNWSNLKPLVQGGAAMLLFQLTLNVAFVTAARRVQAMDPTGVSAAAYGIVMQIYSVGVVCHIGMKASAATLVPSTKASKGEKAARQMADKLFIWGTIVGVILGIVQMSALPFITPMFTTIPEVREAIRIPALITSLLQFINGPLFVGEGVLVGMGKFKALTSCTVIGASVMVASILSPMGKSLNGVLLSLAAFNLIQAIAMVVHHLKIGPFSKRGRLAAVKEAL